MDSLIVLVATVLTVKLIQSFYNKYSSRIIKFIKLVNMDFETIDSLTRHDVVQYRIFHLKFALVNDPDMIHKVLSSDSCLNKPRLIYKLLGTKYALGSEKDECHQNL